MVSSSFKTHISFSFFWEKQVLKKLLQGTIHHAEKFGWQLSNEREKKNILISGCISSTQNGTREMKLKSIKVFMARNFHSSNHRYTGCRNQVVWVFFLLMSLEQHCSIHNAEEEPGCHWKILLPAAHFPAALMYNKSLWNISRPIYVTVLPLLPGCRGRCIKDRTLALSTLHYFPAIC